MRKIVVFLLALLLMVSVAAAENIDYSGMSDQEILNAINQLRAELTKRELNPDKIICDSDGLKVSINGDLIVEKRYDESYKLVIKYIAVNSGEKEVSLSVDKLFVNGWEVSCFGLISLDAGKKEKGEIEVFSIDEKAEVTTADEIEDIELYGYTYDANTFDNLTENIRMKVVFK